MEECDVSNMQELICKSENLKLQYYTNKDVKMMVEFFEGFLKEEIARHNVLSRFLLIECGEKTLKKIEAIYETMTANTEQLKIITDAIDDSHKILKQSYNKIKVSHEILMLGRKFLDEVLSAATYTFIAMFTYLLISIFCYHGFEAEFVVVAPISYFVANILAIWFKNKRIITEFKKTPSENFIYKPIILTCVYQAVITISIFLMILCATNVELTQLIDPTVALIAGSCFGTIFKNWF